MTEATVTIITPAFNCAKYLDETIQSVLYQDYKHIKYIVIDDASEDHTKHVMLWYPDITYIKNEHNIGEQETVNKGLVMVDSKYFMIVNADDPLLPGCVKKLVEAMESKPDVLCAYPDWLRINATGSRGTIIKVRDYNYKYMIDNHVCLPSVGSMFRSSIIQTVGYRDISYRWLGDFDYWYRIGAKGPMLHVPEVLACWRIRNGQASGVKSDIRAKEHIRLGSQFLYNRKAIAWSYIVAAVVAKSVISKLDYIDRAIYEYPQMLVSGDFYKAVGRRIWHVLRR